ncbi:hypothetical protein, partial [Crocosphaera sp.]|uniref:hypothetical protein n=1 Tax=Crocosphaera sp. TaxID=2729996 RepID=UPI00338FA4E4
MSNLINSVPITPKDVATFEQEGAIVLRNLINPEVIDSIRQTFEKIAIPSPLGFT